jgi:hypothetical protein
MNHTAVKVRSAAVAGWWTLLVAVAFAVLLWVAYLAFVKSRPGWVASLLGPDVSWETIQTIWLWIYTVYRLCIWILLLVVVWLTLWARQLRKHASAARGQ